VRTADEVTRCAALLLEAVSKKEKDAAQAYNNAAVKYFGEFARLNKI